MGVRKLVAPTNVVALAQEATCEQPEESAPAPCASSASCASSAPSTPSAASTDRASDLETAFVTHARALERFFVRAGCRADAEDLVAETFMIAHQTQRRFDNTRPLLPWLYGIAVNLARKSRRKHWMRALLDRALLRVPDQGEPPSVVAQLIDAEDVARLREVIDTMPEPKRLVLILREWQGLSPAEVAEALSIPEGSVHSALHYARKELIRRYRQRLAIEGAR